MSRIVFVSPAPIKGSGGIRTILSYAKGLSDAGHEVCVSFVQDGESLPSNLSDQIEQLYGISGLIAHIFPAGLEHADIVVATRWDTPQFIRRVFSGTVVHLIQDIEGWFNPVGDAYLMAENNFLLSSHFITLGHWLAKKQQVDYGEPAFTMDFGYDTSTYHLDQPYEKRGNRICFIYQPEKPRRCTRIGIEALGIVSSARPDCEIVLYGNDTPAHLWYPTTHLGIVSPSALNELYNDCKVGLCISASNPSRIPFEMTACGLPVVDVFRSNNLHDYADENGVLLAHQTPEALAKAILSILDDENVGKIMSREAVSFAANRSMAKEVSQFTSFIVKILNGEKAAMRQDLRPLYSGKAVYSSAYSTSRAQAFCQRQEQEFMSASSATGALRFDFHRGKRRDLRNVVPLDIMLNAQPTCVFPPGLNFDPITHPDGRCLQTHPLSDVVNSVVLPHALPKAVTRLYATVRVANPKSAEMEFSMAVLPALQDPDVKFFPDDTVWEGPSSSGWATVGPGADQVLTLGLFVPTREVSDLHLAVRAKDGASTHFAWCQWLSFSYLQTATEGV